MELSECLLILKGPIWIFLGGNSVSHGSVYNASGKGVRQEKETCKRDRNDTSSCSESASQVFSSENDIGNFVGVPLTDADRRKVLFNCWFPPSGFSFPYVTVGDQNLLLI